jgi:aryl-alcohol dehydrogenase-like predicted oxidoreductase
MYCNGESEVIVGKAIKKYNIPREKVIIMTKCFWAAADAPGTRLSLTCPHLLPFC